MLLLSTARIVVDWVVGPLSKLVLIVTINVDASATGRFQDVRVAWYLLQHVLIMLH